jgi:hypothetical protein
MQAFSVESSARKGEMNRVNSRLLDGMGYQGEFDDLIKRHFSTVFDSIW